MYNIKHSIRERKTGTIHIRNKLNKLKTSIYFIKYITQLVLFLQLTNCNSRVNCASACSGDTQPVRKNVTSLHNGASDILKKYAGRIFPEIDNQEIGGRILDYCSFSCTCAPQRRPSAPSGHFTT